MGTKVLKSNPFQSKKLQSSVYVAKGDSPYENTRSALSLLDLSPVRNKRVLLKPNVGRLAQPGKGITTDPQVVAAAIDAFKEAGAQVAIGESPIVGVKTHEAFDSGGITEVALKRDCVTIDMNSRPFVKVQVSDGLVVHSLKVCPEIFEFDIIVSIPVVKMHMHTGVSLSIKNMKGCLWRRSKVDLHMLPPLDGNDEKPIDIAIADMAGVLTPHLAIIDGNVGMEGLGPSAGKSKFLGVVIVSSDAFAADAVACRLIGTRAEEVPHLRMGSERGYGIIDMDRISVNPDNWKDFLVPFSPPPQNLSIEFPNITVMDKNSCSACQSTLLLFLKRYRKMLFDYFPKNKPINIAIGKGHSELPERTLCIGNCTVSNRNSGIFVSGCPPVGSEIMHAVSGKPSVDFMDGRSETPDLDDLKED